jgi:glycopeptide antibiotics resistance protein
LQLLHFFPLSYFAETVCTYIINNNVMKLALSLSLSLSIIYYIYIYIYKGMKTFQIDLNSIGEWALENVMKFNPVKSNALCFA